MVEQYTVQIHVVCLGFIDVTILMEPKAQLTDNIQESC